MTTIEELLNRLKTDRPAPPADEWDEDRFPFGVAPGGNKYGLTTCPICSKPATKTPRNDLPRAFLFSDELSAKEYRISGMCQACQNSIFCEPDDGE
jgi:hypothetical protein